MTEKAFHDAVLQNHAMPVEMVRAEVLNLPLYRDFKPQWRFADPVTDSTERIELKFKVSCPVGQSCPIPRIPGPP